MVSLDDMKDLVLYKRPFFLPINPKNKKQNSAIMLMTPNFRSSINAMRAPYTINRRYFESYYIEKSVYRYINATNENLIEPEYKGEYLFEVAGIDSDEYEGIDEAVRYKEIVTVSVIIRDKDGNLLVVYDNDIEGLGIPFISVNKGESHEEALVRLCNKQLGINPTNYRLAFDMNFTLSAKGRLYLDYDYCYFVDEYDGKVENKTKSRYASLRYVNVKYLGNTKENISKTLRYIIAKYGKRIVDRDISQYADDKVSASNKVLFTGYTADISEVSRYFKLSMLTNAYDNLDIPLPKYPIHIMCTSITDDEGYIDERNVVVYTKKAFDSLYKNLSYTDYLTYTMQIQAIYNYNPKVSIAIAEPAGLALSGILDPIIAEEDDRNRISEDYITERVFLYILNTYGINEVKKIIKFNDLKLFAKYGVEAALGKTNTDEFNDFLEEASNIMEAEAAKGKKADIPSLDDLSKIGQKIKNKIRTQTVRKLNKIKRDIERGNTGSDSRNTTSLTQLKTNSVVQKVDINSAPAPKTESYTLSQLKDSGVDYISCGNGVFILEDTNNYDLQLRQALYNDRFRSNKAVLAIYNNIKEELSWIKYTYTNLDRYNNKNLFFDLSYYNEAFFRNFAERLNVEEKSNTVKMSKIYAELMSRLLNNDNRLAAYTKKTVFIPVLDWRHNQSTRMWMYREDINPISIIYDMMKNNPTALVKLFGDMDVVFLGGKNYFKINFNKFGSKISDNANLNKFTMLIKRMIALGYDSADPDPEGETEYSAKGIAMDIIDKVEKSQNVEIDNVSAISGLKNGSSDPVVFADRPIKSVHPEPAVEKKINDNISTNKPTGGKQIVAGTTTMNNGKKANIIKKEVELNKQAATAGKADPDASTSINATTDKQKKDAVVDKIAKAAQDASDPDDAMDKLNDDEFKEMILALNTDTEDNVKTDKSRASKMAKIEDQFHNSQVNNKSVKDLLSTNPIDTKLPTSKLPVASINEDWSNLSFMNFDKEYDPDSDIVKMLDSMKNWTYPVAVSEINVTDNSTSEDVLDKWEIKCEDYRGTKFKLVVDIPRFVEGNFLKLRGNEKVLMIQSTQIPIIKTDNDTCQIIGVGGYNKIMISRYGNRAGKSMPSADRLLKAVTKYSAANPTAMKIVYGNNNSICERYELPMDYLDLAGTLDSIETKDFKFYFNQDEFRLHYEIDDTKGVPIGIRKNVPISEAKANVSDVVIYCNEKELRNCVTTTLTGYIGALLCENESFSEVYNNIKLSNVEYTYSRASISSTHMPVIIILGYLEGLVPTLKKARIEYDFVEKINKKDSTYKLDWDYIKFSDGYLLYKVNYSSSLLLNGLKRHDTENYSLKDINSKPMYLDFLQEYGGILKADGLENSYDCMLDPITKELLELYKLPTDYAGVLLRANNLLADNKYISHTDQSVRRWRRKELIAGYFYKALSTSYQSYANSIRHSRKIAKMTMKQSAVIDLILTKDPATDELSVNNVINDVECANTVTNKGLVGLNVDRAYSVDKRIYDSSMLNVFGMDTGFSGNVGINRQATIDANIEGNRGLVKSIDNNTNKLSVAKTLTITEAMVPLGSTHDDPPRTLMTYVQTSKHTMRCAQNDPLLVTNGADEALPYLASDIFSFKAKQDGVIVELSITDDPKGIGNYMVVEYKNGKHEYINLEEQIKKNSAGGYYVPLKLSTDLKEGSRVKAGQVLAYDKSSFAKNSGENNNITATVGTIGKVAIINTDEGFEDSAAITEEFSKKLATDVIIPEDITLDKNANIIVYKKIGDHVMEGESIMAYTTGYEDDEVSNALMKNFNFNQDQISELGRKPVVSDHTGILTGIEIIRTVDLDELSPSLKAFVLEHERPIKRTKSVYNKYNIDTAMLPPTNKVEQIGKAKNVTNGVRILFYIKYADNMSIGDKITFYSANKGVIKYIIPEGEEPYTNFRPNEHIDSFMSISSINGRMTFSIPIMAALNKAMIELDRTVKDIAGIKYDDSKV